VRGRFGSALLGVALVACGGGDAGGDPAPVTACRFEGPGICTEYTRATPELIAAAEEGCALGGGTWGGRCPTSNVVGTCSVSTPTYSLMVTYTPGVYGNAAEAAPACTDIGGAFSAGTATEGPTSPQTFACDYVTPEARLCTDVSGPMSAERRRALEALCGPAHVLPPGVACPAEGRVGTCARPASAPGVTAEDRFYDPSIAAAAAADCASDGGVWTAG
jgi:hypothetical protein